jgi:transposase
MPSTATPVVLTDEDRQLLEQRARATTTPARDLQRAQIILLAAQGWPNDRIAAHLHLSPGMVSRWRMRFLRQGLAGLADRPRSGRPQRYGSETERRLLAQLDEKPPSGYAAWSGELLARALGDVSSRQVYRVLRRQRISLQRRRSWCVSTDPEFVRKAADIVGLYLAPPENAVVLCVDEKPHIQALERAQGWLKLPNGRALTGRSHEYTRHGTTTLFAGLEVATGQVQTGHYQRRRRREFLDFMNELVGSYPPDQELHVILDNLNTHKPQHDRWLARHRNVHLHFTPTHACWLNQIEVWFSILSRQALRGASFTSPRQLRQAMDRFLAAYNDRAAPFEWTKAEVHPVGLKNKYKDLWH